MEMVGDGHARDGPMNPMPDANEQEFIRWLLTQGALAVVTLITLFFYRRDFGRKVEQKDRELLEAQEEKAELRALLREHATSTQQVAISLNNNTHATERLARAVEELAHRRRRDDDSKPLTTERV